MKKIIISLTLIVAMIFGNLQLVFASGVASYTVNTNTDGDSFVVSGDVTGAKSNVLLTLVVEMQGGGFLAGEQTVARRNDDGMIVFNFEEVKFPYSATTGVYTFTVTGDEISAPSQIPTYKYVSIEDKRQLLADVNALSEAGGNGLYEKIADYTDVLGIVSSDFAALSTDSAAKTAFNNTLKSATYIVPDAVDTDEQILQVKTSCYELSANVKVALAVGSFSNIKNANMTKAWISKYYNGFEFDKDDKSTPEDENLINKYLGDVKGTDTFASRIAACDDVSSLKDVRDDINESILLSAIETMHFSNTYGIITGFPSLFTINNSNLAKLGNLSSDAPGDIYTKIAKVSYKDYDAVITAFDNAVTAAILSLSDDDDDNKTDGGGWRGGGGGSVSITSPKENTTDTPLESGNATKGFTDLAGVEWARDAIVYLSERGIINGKADGIFAPGDFITRAEFIKILVGALNAEIKLDDKPSFDDVYGNKWYTPYIAAAEKNNLVQGSGNNLFMPDSNISRQDVAVILYRAFKPVSISEPLKFNDSIDISDYAVEAINSLTAANVINGMDDGTFSPLAGATRAQAAVMIYKLIKQ